MGSPSFSGYAAANAAPASAEQAVAQLRTQWVGQEGTTRTWVGAGPISYNIPDAPYASGTPEGASFVAMAPAMREQARLAFELWDDVIARDLTETGPGPGGIQFGYASATSGGGTYTRFSGVGGGANEYGATDYAILREEVWINSRNAAYDSAEDVSFGQYGFMIYIHEIGHALGLSHPGTYNAGGAPLAYGTSAEYLEDTQRFTVMSYFNAQADGSGTDHFGASGAWRYASTPMRDDIAALQAAYGADTTTRTGDTVYGFGSNAGRAVYDFALNPDPILAIWDAGGTDTLSAAGYATRQRIDLTPGAYSDIGALTNNVAIAYGAIIENAIGGSGDDLIIGNAVANMLAGAAGDDILVGGAGDDVLDGGNGIDTARFAGLSTDASWADNGDGTWRVVSADGIDTLVGVERLAFADRIVDIGGLRATAMNSALATVRITGTAGDDVLNGGAGDDELSGENGNDRIFGGDGADRLRGGHGNDRLSGGHGDDKLEGGTGDDELFGEDGSDELRGDEGQDKLEGGHGNDRLWGGDGDDVLSGGTGDDRLEGARGNDTLRGDDGNDRLEGGDGDDKLEGGDGDDELEGGDGSDRLEGAGGNDRLGGGNGNDVLLGGDGDDRLYGHDGDDEIAGDNGSDELAGDAGRDRLSGGDGNDRLSGGDGEDELNGGSGEDELRGDSGNDALWGESGHDRLFGGSGEDRLFGGEGDDQLFGEDGHDRLEGNAGNDRLEGGRGDDVLFGGDSGDVFVFGADFGRDTVADFRSDDVIEFRDGVFANFEAVLARAVQSGGDTVIESGAGVVVLQGVERTSLNADDFRFV